MLDTDSLEYPMTMIWLFFAGKIHFTVVISSRSGIFSFTFITSNIIIKIISSFYSLEMLVIYYFTLFFYYSKLIEKLFFSFLYFCFFSFTFLINTLECESDKLTVINYQSFFLYFQNFHFLQYSLF